MMTLRDRARVYKSLSLMLLLAVVTVTFVQIGNISSEVQFQTDREALQAATVSKRALLKKDPLQDPVSFWNAGPRKPQPTPDGQTGAEDRAPRTWDVTSTNCTANPNFTSVGWFAGLEPNFKQFLLYRHCKHFPMIINHPEKCGEEIYLLMVIKSIITQHDRREVIRQTWGREQVIDGKKVKTLFLLGVPSSEEEKAHHQKLLEYENFIYGDILQWDFMDTFFNLTLKETHFLKWFHMYCHDVRYIFKGDDDVFVNVPNIFEYLASTSAENLFVGDVLFRAKPIRKKENKYYIPQALYNKTHYPPYAGGGGFLMEGALARKLSGACETLDLYPIDDVFLGMCLEVLRVAPIKHNAFKTFGLVKDKSSRLNREPCFFKSMIVVHKLLPPDLLQMWKMVHSDLVCAQKAALL
ncbi:hypothetical protein MATL_G00240210 [Megalops atlanticus]|uniref:Hexosyltransferase n=1 Tax=Megalops atlanticus TaxID=7932 RepID=A0A9D3T1K4_MEGAT|nr:hypothetical protein MATL_G00240210 [Megalops atlanticus]